LKTRALFLVLISILTAVLMVSGCGQSKSGEDSQQRFIQTISAFSADQAPPEKLKIRYPLDETLFPPDIVAPTFRWEDYLLETDVWLVSFRFQDGGEPMRFLADKKEWTPSEEDWATIKKRSLETPVKVSILGVQRSAPKTLLSGAQVSISTSKDEVGAPIFFRDVNLPFATAVTDPSKIRWRLGSISSREMPRLLLDGIPTCANCHSFSRDGKVYGMEVDAADDKGAYLISPVQKEISICPDNVMSWSEFRKEDKKKTFGLLAQISPDGQNVICMVKDRSVSIPKPEIEFSQLFFPIQGILANYNIATKTFKEVPGASDPAYVQANVTWSPDGKEIAFARHEVYHLSTVNDDVDQLVLSPEQAKEFLVGQKPFKFDLYRLPYNEGNGGTPVPIEGASNNGVSNYFAKYSPDGKWIVFCRAKNYMLLQPDSELYIIPAAGGEARRLRGNTGRMNSWHSWSPNSKWLVFSSKVNGPYTQLHLTHIDEQGNSTPPVVLSHFTEPGRAANIPEFLNAPADAIEKIKQDYITDGSFVGAGDICMNAGEPEKAVSLYRKALTLNPNNEHALNNLAYLLTEKGEVQEALQHIEKALTISKGTRELYSNYANTLEKLGRLPEATEQYRKALELEPQNGLARLNLGLVLMKQKQDAEGEECFRKVLEVDPDNAAAHYNLGQLYYYVRKQEDKALEEFNQTLRLKPDHADALYGLGHIASVRGQGDEAVRFLTKAVESQPNHLQSLIELGGLLCMKNDYAKGESYLARAVSLSPKNPLIRYRLALAQFRLGKAEQGQQMLTSAAELDPKYRDVPEAPFLLSLYYAEQKNFQQAEILIQQALSLARSNGGKASLIQQMEKNLASYRQGQVPQNGPVGQN